MSAEARANGWRGFEGIGEKVEHSGGLGRESIPGGWLYQCDGMPSLAGCGSWVIVPRRWSRVGLKKSGWLVTYGKEPNTPDAPFDDPSQWHDDKDVVLTFCPSCAEIVQEQEKTK